MSWLEDYELIENNDGTTTIVLPVDEKKITRSFILYKHQIMFLKENYPAKTISESLRKLIDDLIKKENNIGSIVQTK